MADMNAADAGKQTAPHESIESLYAALESALLLYALRFVKQNESAQDIVQEAFMKLHAEFSSVKQPQAWLYRTVHNLSLNHLRAGSKVVALPEDRGNGDGGPVELADAQPMPDEYLARMEAIGQTRLCLDELSPRSRELIRLKFEEGLSYKQISERTQLSMSNVGFLLHHALKDLNAALRRTGVAP
jgi:RNA polymerase sigma-70 factor (ECF subfamily)